MDNGGKDIRFSTDHGFAKTGYSAGDRRTGKEYTDAASRNKSR